MTAKDRYRIALNILAQTGIDNPNFISEYSKTIAFVHAMGEMPQRNTPVTPPMPQQGMPMANMPAQGQNNALQGSIPPQTGVDTTQQGIMPQIA